MIRTVNDITLKLIVLLLISSFVLVFINNAVFYHSHKLANGEVVSHAHPYNKTTDSQPFKSHHHSKTELLFLQNIQLLFASVFALTIGLLFFQKIKIIFPKNVIYNSKPLFNLRNRAPPDFIR